MATTDSMTLPAMKHLADLASLRPCVIVDNREKQALRFSRLPSCRGTLQTGDYSGLGVEHLFSIERKSIPDLIQCVGRERTRFESELCRLRGYPFHRLVIEGTTADIESQCRGMNPKSVLHSLCSWEVRYSMPYVFAGTRENAAHMIESWLYWFCRECVESTNNLLRGLTAETTAV
jgi:DNA excision repair protein ERCC-4